MMICFCTESRAQARSITVVGDGGRRLPDSIYRYTDVNEIRLYNFSLSRMPKRLMKMPSLSKLVIKDNRSRKRFRFPGNTSLDTLILSRNKMKKFPDVHRCRNLARLDLNFNEIAVIPRSVRRSKKLRSLNLNNNQVWKINAGIERLSLEELGLYKCKLNEIPPLLYRMTSLKVIDLFSNKIKTISPRIGNLKNLEILYIAGNEIAAIPEEIGELHNLRELYIHHNYLITLPVSIRSLTSLHTLRMNNNYMMDWPAQLMELKNLKNFDCSDNPWSDEAKKQIAAWAKLLRSNNTFVVE